ncbi:MAG TPA: ABC transporter substrate-binding protein, partial [Stellaceae bacterium]|nr:ABC transporter substrate-binding protein [Stellaceae bacterium]
KGSSFDQRYQLLQPAIERAFDLGLMTRIAVGPEWVDLPAAQQQELAAAFARYTIATYASRFDGYSGERFVVEPTSVPNPNGVIVESRLVQSDGKPVTLNYLMRRGARGTWQIIDVYLSGTISELATRRSEFVAVLQRDGAKGLVRLLQRRAAALRTG